MFFKREEEVFLDFYLECRLSLLCMCMCVYMCIFFHSIEKIFNCKNWMKTRAEIVIGSNLQTPYKHAMPPPPRPSMFGFRILQQNASIFWLFFISFAEKKSDRKSFEASLMVRVHNESFHIHTVCQPFHLLISGAIYFFIFS